MRALVLLASKIGPASVPVLISGETGVGKEVVAELIHAYSERREKPMVCINCAGLPDELIESELFGSAKGAFTGSTNRIGLLASAAGSTVLLDELSEMPLHLQSKLLRFLQDMIVRPVGRTASQRIDVRVIAAINREPSLCVREKHLREDLYYRLSTIMITVPPLRLRLEDILPLASAYIAYYADLLKRPALTLSESAKAALKTYHWPGNVRQLQNEMNRCMLLSDGGEILPSQLGFFNEYASTEQLGVPAKELSILERTVAQTVVDTLTACKWNKAKAAKMLGIGRQKMYNEIARYDIKTPKKARAAAEPAHPQP